jgi:hypothetical protein
MSELQNIDNSEFIRLLRQRIEAKISELATFEHDSRRILVQIERLKENIEKLNAVLESEGEDIIPMKRPLASVGVGKIGNRSKEFPLRKTQWDGMTVNEIVSKILESAPNSTFKANEIIPLIYEIQTNIDIQKVTSTMRSVMQKGERANLWVRTGRGKYKAKTLVNV